MILLSTISLKDKTIETTDVVNIANGADLHDPEVVKGVVANRFGIKKESLVITEYSPFNNTYIFEWEGVDSLNVCTREVIAFWSVLK